MPLPFPQRLGLACVVPLLLAAASGDGPAAPRLELVVQAGHAGGVDWMVYTPDGRDILSASDDRTIKLWDAETCHEIRTFAAAGPGAVSPDSRLLACLDYGRRDVRVLELASGRLVSVCTGAAGPVVQLAWDPAGRRVAAASLDGRARVWDAASGARLAQLGDSGRPKTAVAFSPDGARLAVGDRGGGIRFYDTAHWLLGGAHAAQAVEVRAIAFAPDGRTVATLGRDGSLRLRAAAHGGLLWRNDTASASPNAPLAFSADGGRVGTVLVDGGVARFAQLAAATGREVAATRLRLVGWGMARICAPSPDWQHVASPNGFIQAAGDGELVRTVKGYARPLAEPVFFSADGRRLLARSWAYFYKDFSYMHKRQVLRLWDLELAELKGGRDADGPLLDLSPDGRRLAQAALEADGTAAVELVETSRWTAAGRLAAGATKPYRLVARFAPDGTRLALTRRVETLAGRDDVAVVAIAGGKTLATVGGHSNDVDCLAWSADGARLAVGSSRGMVSVHEAATGRELRRYDAGNVDLRALSFSPDGGRLHVVYTVDLRGRQFARIVTFDLVSRTRIDHPYVERAPFTDLAPSPDGRHVAAVFDEPLVRELGARGDFGKYTNGVLVYETATGKIVAVLPFPAGSPRRVTWSGDGRFLACGGTDGALRVLSMATRRSVNAFCTADEWVLFTDDGYFDGSRFGGQLVAAVQGRDVCSVEQFAVRLNRPEILLERLGGAPAALIDHFRAQYEKRLRRLGLADGGRHGVRLPRARITAARPAGKFLEIEAVFDDDGGGLAAWQAYVNNVPLYGAGGLPIAGHTREVRARIELTAGQNKVEVACLAASGAESLRALTYAQCRERPAADLYYIGFGVSRYRDRRLDLGYAAQDAVDLAALFKSMEGKAFRAVHAVALTNDQVTRGTVGAARRLLSTARPDDVFVLFIAGHGLHDRDRAATYYYLTHETDPDRLAATAADFQLVEGLLQGIAPRAKLFLMDTCESGEADERALRRLTGPAPAPGKGKARARTWSPGAATNAAAGYRGTLRLPGGRELVTDRNRYAYNDLARRSGAIVFSACRGDEVSYEHDELANGFFTESIVKAFADPAADADRDGFVSTEELRAYVAGAVPDLCRIFEFPADRWQHPTVDRDNLWMRFVFPSLAPR